MCFTQIFLQMHFPLCLCNLCEIINDETWCQSTKQMSINKTEVVTFVCCILKLALKTYFLNFWLSSVLHGNAYRKKKNMIQIFTDISIKFFNNSNLLVQLQGLRSCNRNGVEHTQRNINQNFEPEQNMLSGTLPTHLSVHGT